jgi:hypothetical protein
MDKQQKIDLAVETAKAAQIRDDVCSRSVLLGLREIFGEIPDAMVTASTSLLGGTGAASGSCGAYCAGLLGVGLKFNPTVDEAKENPTLMMGGIRKTMEYRDKFLASLGTVLCPQIHEKLFGRSYILTDPEQEAEFLSLEGHEVKCAEVVGEAARIAAEMILSDIED